MELAKALCLVSILAINTRLSSGDATLSIRFNSYVNPKGKGDNGNCCDGFGSLCRGKCDHYFHICLDHPSSSNNDIFACPLGKVMTAAVQEFNSIPSFGNPFGTTDPKTENPILVDIPGPWEGGVLMRIDVMDLDKGNTNDLVEQLKNKVMTAPDGQMHDVQPTNRVRSKTRTTLSLTVSATCKDGFYGPRCDCQDGTNYDCDHDSGDKICHAGWTGPDCDQEVAECDSQPCQHGGTCIEGEGFFRCECTEGYAGDMCERDVDGCQDNPCHGTATCESPPGVLFQCVCAPNYTGQRCETLVVMPCDSNPCEHSGRCTNVGADYTCDCQGGYTGASCETEINECASNPCGNNSECHDLADRYDCTCMAGWEGADCDVNIDDCVNHKCKTGSTCVDEVGNYHCQCPIGVVGVYCDEPRCGAIYCLNGGSCVDPGPVCSCTPDYTGEDCAIYRKCVEEPCENKGTCVAHPTPEHWCACGWHHYGQRCEKELQDCPHKYTEGEKLMCDHAQMKEKTHLSLCWPAEEGVTGKQEMDQLCYVEEPCQCENGGTCFLEDGELTCICTAEYTGPRCATETGTGPAFIFSTKLKNDEIEAFVDTIHDSTVSVLAKNDSDIHVFHDVYLCKANKTRYTVIVADIFEEYNLINADCENDVFDDVRVAVVEDKNYTDSDTFTIGKLDKRHCELTDPSSVGPHGWAPRPKLFGLIVGVCVVTVVFLVFGLIVWKFQRPSPAYNIPANQFGPPT